MQSPRRRLNLTDDLAPDGANTVTPAATTVPDDPVESAKQRIRNRQLLSIMICQEYEDRDATNLPDSKRAIFWMLERRNVWRWVKNCKSPEDLHELMWDCTFAHSMLRMTLGDALEKALKHDSLANTPLREIVEEEVEKLDVFGTSMFALGIIRGMQFGRELDSKTQGNVDSLLKHAAVKRLLLRKPKASNLEVCRALDKVEGLPWPKLRKQYGTWDACSNHQSVRTLITNARQTALQDAMYQEFLSVADGVGDKGSITNKFRTKKYPGLVKAKR